MSLELTGMCMGGIDAIKCMEDEIAPLVEAQNDPTLEESFNRALNRFRYEIKKSVPVPVKELRGRRITRDCGNCGHVVDVGYEYCPNCGRAIDWKHRKVTKLR